MIANLCIAGTFMPVLVLWDLFGHLTLPLGVAGHEESTVIVGLSGLRMLSGSVWDGSSSRVPDALLGSSERGTTNFARDASKRGRAPGRSVRIMPGLRCHEPDL